MLYGQTCCRGVAQYAFDLPLPLELSETAPCCPNLATGLGSSRAHVPVPQSQSAAMDALALELSVAPTGSSHPGRSRANVLFRICCQRGSLSSKTSLFSPSVSSALVSSRATHGSAQFPAAVTVAGIIAVKEILSTILRTTCKVFMSRNLAEDALYRF